VNVTWSLWMFMSMLHMMRSGRVWVNKLFMWMLHEVYECLCQCYMMRSGGVWASKLFMWMLHEVYMNVYVNVAWWEVEEFE
jgi:hypothetical protein